MKKILTMAWCVLACAQTASSQINLIDDFSSDPLATSRWTFGVGDNSNTQYGWSATSAAYTGDAVGSLSVHLDSGLPTARLQRPIGSTLNQDTDFTFIVQFRFSIMQANVDEGIQMAFGLVNSGLTGGDRTGSFSEFFSDNVFHTVEFNYFPNTSTFNAATPGPSLTGAVFGAQKPGADAFGNFAGIFGEDGDLGGNLTGITELPQMTTLQVILNYSALSRVISLTLQTVNPDGSFSLLDTGLPSMDLDTPPGFSSYDTAFPFEVDTIAIMAYQDGFTNPADPSLIADMVFERFELISPVPEPSSMLLVGVGVLATVCRRRRF